MEITLSKEAMEQVTKNAEEAGLPIENFVSGMLEGLLKSEHMYMMISPVPPQQALDAIGAFINQLLSAPLDDFYGFKFLSRAEAIEARQEYEGRIIGPGSGGDSVH